MSPVTGAGDRPKGTVMGTAPNGSAIPGSVITLYISDGTVRAAPPPGPAPPPPGAPGLPPLPRLPPIPIPIPLPR